MSLYPLRFEPLFRQYLWGGRRLEMFLNKPLGNEPRYAESWEIVDRPEAQSIVSNGVWRGKSLAELVRTERNSVVGKATDGRFPLLLKFLDCQLDLSVQVHPDDTYAAKLVPPDLGKTEAWYVIHAEPHSKLYAGLKTGITRQELAAAISAGRTAECLHAFEPYAGDCVFIPAGTVHALGAGLIVAEIQQSSDTTFRLFDWNRTDVDGKARPLHIDQALEVMNFERGPVLPEIPRRLSATDCVRLVDCDKFVLNRWSADKSTVWEMNSNDRFRILCMIAGNAELLTHNLFAESLNRGDSLLIPAALGRFVVKPTPGTVLLESFLP